MSSCTAVSTVRLDSGPQRRIDPNDRISERGLKSLTAGGLSEQASNTARGTLRVSVDLRHYQSGLPRCGDMSRPVGPPEPRRPAPPSHLSRSAPAMRPARGRDIGRRSVGYERRGMARILNAKEAMARAAAPSPACGRGWRSAEAIARASRVRASVTPRRRPHPPRIRRKQQRPDMLITRTTKLQEGTRP